MTLIPPYGDVLVDLLAPAERVDALKEEAARLPFVTLSDRAVCDLELLATGAFSPLRSFMGREDYRRVLTEMRLVSGLLFPIPITLPVPADPPLRAGDRIALRDGRSDLLAVMTLEEVYDWDREEFAERVTGTTDARHPLVAELPRWGQQNISGALEVIALPSRPDFRDLRLTPADTRARLEAIGRARIVAFQTRNPLYRAHEELLRATAAGDETTVLLHPVVGMTRPGEVDYYTRVRTYKAVLSRYFEPDRVLLALLPLAMRMAGPREALWHALIRRNYGANGLIIGRHHASPGVDSHGRPFYGPYDAQQLVHRHAEELGVRVVPIEELVYLPEEQRYEARSRVPDGARIASVSGTQVREEYLQRGRRLPEWLMRPEVAEILEETYPPRHRQGFCVWFTGLSGAGKSATAEVLTVLLMEHGRHVTVLDGDVVRTHLSAGLGFSKADRDTSVRRMGFVAAEIVRHGGVVICAAVSPYRATRDECRAMVGTDRFIEVFVDTPLRFCEARDPKGHYAKARRGEITGFTGIDDPYEAPLTPEFVLDTVSRSTKDNAGSILAHLLSLGLVLS